ncbi:radical SAM protein [Candidatus Poribacteria bacterium]
MEPTINKISLEHSQLYSRLLGAHLRRILKLVGLESREEAKSADSFCYLPSASPTANKSPTGKLRSTSYSVKSYARNEPRIELIKRGLERALRMGEFRHNGSQLSVSGFRWRDLKDWASYGPMAPFDAIGALSSQCNCDCEFCHAKTLMMPTLSRSQLSLSEAATRMKYFMPETGRGLPPTTRLPLEPFSNPFSIDILRLMREAAPGQLITEETNGSFLNEDAVAQLAELKPVFLIISMNGISTDVRQNRMRETDETATQTAIQSPELLQKYGIPFAISYVPWPNRGLEEIAEVVRFAEEVSAARARVCLPVTHRFAHPDPPFNREEYWEEILQFVQELRPSASIPIGTTPTIYEWQTILPVICGTIKDSPGGRAGIRYGDTIMSIEGEQVITRREARRMLADRAKSDAYSSTQLVIERCDNLMDVEIQHSRPLTEEPYPYRELLPDVFPFGIEIPYGVGLSDAMTLQSICEEHRGQRLLVLLPDIVSAQFRQAILLIADSVPVIDEVELYLWSVEPNFYGGGWLPARWWTVSDIVEAVNNWKEQAKKELDAVVIPAGAFSPGGRDVLGGTINDLEQQLDVELCRISVSSVVT